jgi:hypothetical protein
MRIRGGYRTRSVGFATIGAILGVLSFGLTACSSSSPSKPAASKPLSSSSPASSQGVTATTIRVGIPYVDFSAVTKVGVHLDPGSFPDAYNALIANINAHGGILGRKIVPYLLAVDPTSLAPGLTACTQMTEDDKVFVVIDALMPDCYLTHHTPSVAAILQSSGETAGIPNFTLSPPASAYDPLQLGVFAKNGVFNGKKVGLFAGETTDETELGIVKSALDALHVDVVQTAVDSAPGSDLVASNQQVAVIAQRFRSSGINEVVAVGYGSAVWPEALASNQSSYNPPWVATNSGDLTGYTGGVNNPTYIKNVVVSSPILQATQTWNDPAIQSCVSIIRKAYPSDNITAPPKVATNSSHETYTAPEAACTDLAIFETIAKAAGKSLTVSSFIQAGENLHNVTFPGAPAPVSFAPGRAYALGPVYLGHYDTTAKTLEYSNTSANG